MQVEIEADVGLWLKNNFIAGCEHDPIRNVVGLLFACLLGFLSLNLRILAVFVDDCDT